MIFVCFANFRQYLRLRELDTRLWKKNRFQPIIRNHFTVNRNQLNKIHRQFVLIRVLLAMIQPVTRHKMKNAKLKMVFQVVTVNQVSFIICCVMDFAHDVHVAAPATRTEKIVRVGAVADAA